MEKVTAIAAKVSSLLSTELPDGTCENIRAKAEAILTAYINTPAEGAAGKAKKEIHEAISLYTSGSAADHVCNAIHNDVVDLYRDIVVPEPAEEVKTEPVTTETAPEAVTPVEEKHDIVEVPVDPPPADESKSQDNAQQDPAPPPAQKKNGGASSDKPALKEKTFSEVPEKDTFYISDDGAIAKFQKTSKTKAKCMQSKLEGYDKGETYTIAAKKKVSH